MTRGRARPIAPARVGQSFLGARVPDRSGRGIQAAPGAALPPAGDRRQQRQARRGRGVRGVVDGENLPVSVRNRKLLVVELGLTDERMVDHGAPVAPDPRIVTGPQLAEAPAAHGQFPDQRVERRVVDVRSDPGAQCGDDSPITVVLSISR
jgi:hypothetical protein